MEQQKQNIYGEMNTEDNIEQFFVEYEDKDEDNINHDTFDEAKVEYDLFISRGEKEVRIWKRFGFGNEDIICVWRMEQQKQNEKKEAEWKKKYLKRCIERVEKSYNTNIFICPRLQEEIDLLYPITSGCWFMDWLNHRLYAEVMMITITLEVETPAYIDWEELEDSDTDDEN